MRRVEALGALALPLALAFCAGPVPVEGRETAPEEEAAAQHVEEADPFRGARLRMVQQDIARRGVRDEAVLHALRTVPRHRFVPEVLISQAYEDRPLSIGQAQTISQPYIVALMTELAELSPTDRVLEVGTGSGYQAAVLAEIVEHVYSIEILEELSRSATSLLETLGYENVETRVGDGYGGWPEAAPFDAILVTAAPPRIPQPLIDQIALGGRMVIPVGRAFQELMVLERTAEGVKRHRSIPVRFVPMTGEAQDE